MSVAKYYDESTEQWIPVSQAMALNNFIYDEEPTGDVDGSNTSFSTANAYITGTLEVFINGLKQAHTTHITEIDPSSGTFTIDTAPQTGDIVRVNYQQSVAASGNAQTLSGSTLSEVLNRANHTGQTPPSGIDTNESVDNNDWNLLYLGGKKVYYKMFTGLSSSSLTTNSQETVASGLTLPDGIRATDYIVLSHGGHANSSDSRFRLHPEINVTSTSTSQTFGISARNLTASSQSLTNGILTIALIEK